MMAHVEPGQGELFGPEQAAGRYVDCVYVLHYDPRTDREEGEYNVTVYAAMPDAERPPSMVRMDTDTILAMDWLPLDRGQYPDEVFIPVGLRGMPPENFEGRFGQRIALAALRALSTAVQAEISGYRVDNELNVARWRAPNPGAVAFLERVHDAAARLQG
jgi:hypothetical protein